MIATRIQKTLAVAAAAVGVMILAGAPVRADDAAAPAVAEIIWETDLDAAAERARREGKPILLVQGFGEPSEPFC